MQPNINSFKARQNLYSEAMRTGNYQNFFQVTKQPRSLIIDPQSASSAMGYYSKQTSLSYPILRQMAKMPLPAAVIKTRKNQIAEFLHPQESKYSKGFVIQKRSKADRDNQKQSYEEKKYIEKLNKFVMNCGEESSAWQWDSLDTFMRKVIEDSLTFDQACFEVIPYMYGKLEPHSFVAVDAETIRIVDSYDNYTNTHTDKMINGVYPSYCQVYEGMIRQEFYPWEMCFGIRNPSTRLQDNGYGTSELENLIGIITHLVNADSYNGNFFKNGSSPNGILLAKGDNSSNEQIAQFRQDWNACISGVGNAHKTPILSAEGFEWLNFQHNNREMEYFKFVEYLVKLTCAVFTISGEEIGFKNEGSYTGSMGGKNNEQEKAYSLAKGLFPLLTSSQIWMDRMVIGPKTNDVYEFKFAGMDAETEKEEDERLYKSVNSWMTVNEARKIKGFKPRPECDIILSPVMQQSRQNDLNEEMQRAQMDMLADDENDQNAGGDGDASVSAVKKSEDNPFKRDLRDFELQHGITAL